MKNILVEQYSPLEVDGKLMINENRINWFAVAILLAALVIIGIALIDAPESLFALVLLLALLAMPITFATDDHGWSIMYLIRKKRAKVNAHLFHDFCHPWYSRGLTEIDAGYKEKIMDYLDYLREGGERSKTAERHLSDWYDNAKQMQKKREQQKDKDIASMFVNDEQLKAYRKALQDVEKSVR